MTDTLKYIRSDSTCTQNRFESRDRGDDVYWSIGPNFDCYDFLQKPSNSYKNLILKRIKDIRNRYDYIRLWFTGGRDSRLVLDTALENNIHIDEIVSIRQNMFNEKIKTLQLLEWDDEVPFYLEKHKENLKKTKINLIDFKEKHYIHQFQQEKWWEECYVWQLASASVVPPKFYRYPHNDFDLPLIANSVDLLGSIHPHIWFDKSWKFEFIDQQFQFVGGDGYEWFNVSNDMPELIHAYSWEVIQIMERKNIYPKRHSMSVNQIRNMHPLYNDIKLYSDLPSPPKTWNTWTPNYPWFRVRCSFRSMMTLLLCYMMNPHPEVYRVYTKKGWDKIESEWEYGGICSKTFNLKK
jgi:hypothetical protein